MSDDSDFLMTCANCNRDFQYGMHIYAGRPSAQPGFMVCNRCARPPEDIPEHIESKLKKMAAEAASAKN